MIASKRELIEETGLVAKTWLQLGNTRVCDGLMTERMITLLARDLKFEEKPLSDDSNVIADGKFFSIAEIHHMIETGAIDEGQSITAIYFIEQWLTKNNKH